MDANHNDNGHALASLQPVFSVPDLDASELHAPRSSRDPLGRFLPGCPPGPGRPRKAANERLRHVPGIQILADVMELEATRDAWETIIRRLGPDSATDFLKDLEATYGPIRFRHLALAAIAAARHTPPPKSSKRRKKKPR